jgi:hypothetical protein
VKSLKQIMREVSPESLQSGLRESQRDLDKQLSAVIAQIQRQADSTFGEQTWTEASWPEFGERLLTHAKQLIAQGERLRMVTNE